MITVAGVWFQDAGRLTSGIEWTELHPQLFVQLETNLSNGQGSICRQDWLDIIVIPAEGASNQRCCAGDGVVIWSLLATLLNLIKTSAWCVWCVWIVSEMTCAGLEVERTKCRYGLRMRRRGDAAWGGVSPSPAN